MLLPPSEVRLQKGQEATAGHEVPARGQCLGPRTARDLNLAHDVCGGAGFGPGGEAGLPPTHAAPR